MAGHWQWLAFSVRGDHTAGPQGNGPDATVFISTLILIYTVFVTVHGTLLAQVTDARRWEWLILGLMVLAIVADLWRIQNSVGDLHATTLQRLPADRVDDAAYEFIYYFYGNVIVLIAVLVFLAVRKRRP